MTSRAVEQAAGKTQVEGSPREPRNPREPKISGETGGRRLLLPREHGAWGLVLLPFLAGALVAGGWASWRVVAALVAVLAVFLLRQPLVVLWRDRSHRRLAPRQAPSEEIAHAKFSLLVCLATLVGAGTLLLLEILPLPLLVLGAGAAMLMFASVLFAVRNVQRHPAVQMVSVLALTASSLLGYLAARGTLEDRALWVWGLSAAHGLASVLVVRARLEAMVAQRKAGVPPDSLGFRRNAVRVQAALWGLLGVLALAGRPEMLVPFLPPSLLHWWELRQLGSGRGSKIPLRRVGFLQLGASVLFCILLVVALR